MYKASELADNVINGRFDDKILSLCLDGSRLDYERSRYADALKTFTGLFGDSEVSVFSAPGRSEVCGNHTDHQRWLIRALLRC